ncbi:MAG: OsmC family protein [Oligoflexia bacterium]|nr:OsmC family protein [Oligoflexia bacterium]
MKREAQAVWKGGGKTGQGELTTQSGVLRNTAYSFTGRFENGTGTNPEELVGAAHAGCFSMALAVQLEAAGLKPQELRTSAAVIMEKQGAGWGVTEVRLTLQARIPGVSESQFLELANQAKGGCPISRLLNAKITLDAKLVQ